jgi:hypothetical protein
MSGGDMPVEISKANGTAERSMEVEVTLSVGKRSLEIELLGEDD